MGEVRYVRVADEPLEDGGTTYCGREYTERDNTEFVGPAHPIHVKHARGGPHDSLGNPAVRDGDEWVVEIPCTVPDTAEVEGGEA